MFCISVLSVTSCMLLCLTFYFTTFPIIFLNQADAQANARNGGEKLSVLSGIEEFSLRGQRQHDDKHQPCCVVDAWKIRTKYTRANTHDIWSIFGTNTRPETKCGNSNETIDDPLNEGVWVCASERVFVWCHPLTNNKTHSRNHLFVDPAFCCIVPQKINRKHKIFLHTSTKRHHEYILASVFFAIQHPTQGENNNSHQSNKHPPLPPQTPPSSSSSSSNQEPPTKTISYQPISVAVRWVVKRVGAQLCPRSSIVAVFAKNTLTSIDRFANAYPIDRVVVMASPRRHEESYIAQKTTCIYPLTTWHIQTTPSAGGRLPNWRRQLFNANCDDYVGLMTMTMICRRRLFSVM